MPPKLSRHRLPLLSDKYCLMTAGLGQHAGFAVPAFYHHCIYLSYAHGAVFEKDRAIFLRQFQPTKRL